MVRFSFALIAVLLLLPLPTLAQEPEIPQPLDYISDYAGVLDEGTESYLNGLLKELEEKTTAEIAVLTVGTTQPLDIFDYGMEVFERWKIGKEGKDNGLLFLVAVEDRQMYIFTGYGLEGILPDGKVGEIRDRDIIPYFKLGDYAGGIRKGVETIAGIIAQDAGVELTGLSAGEEPPTTPSNIRNAMIVLLFLFFLLYFLFFRPRRHRRGWLFPWIFWWGSGTGGFGSGGFGGGGFSGGGFGGFGGGASGGGGAGGGW